MNILLVEDHQDTQRVLSTLLKHSGHQILVASNYLQALRLLVRTQPEVLLCDLGLPDGDGLDLVAKAKMQRPGIKTIAVTGRASDEEREIGLKAGFDHYVTKPLDFQALRALLAADK
ncbi:MAG: hypothetical protein DMF06_00355 [Verrucomicrobia bacterium]|nr:MAG: hypothetical protein DMF06_00355 [Verrucomicrobiota bacterium]